MSKEENSTPYQDNECAGDVPFVSYSRSQSYSTSLGFGTKASLNIHFKDTSCKVTKHSSRWFAVLQDTMSRQSKAFGAAQCGTRHRCANCLIFSLGSRTYPAQSYLLCFVWLGYPHDATKLLLPFPKRHSMSS